ncbi:class I SAM-dependent methyltransferase [Streptomyces sp. NPDC001833]|uniref:O-methyltransferase n=1 Tax=Streptomyces sp. NPDC001833 TaxID=3154658 RepID=UPI003329F891
MCQHGPPADRLLRLRTMTPDAARLISTPIRARRATSVLEIGTSNGYSAIWFADALRDTGGRLTTVDIDADRVTAAYVAHWPHLRRVLKPYGILAVGLHAMGDGVLTGVRVR